MLNKLDAARIAAAAIFVATLTQAVPALAEGPPAGSDSIISPGLGTLGAIFEWLLRLLA